MKRKERQEKGEDRFVDKKVKNIGGKERCRGGYEYGCVGKRGRKEVEAEMIMVERGRKEVEAEMIMVVWGRKDLKVDMIMVEWGRKDVEADMIMVERGRKDVEAV